MIHLVVMDYNKRDFLKLSGAVIGSSVTAGCLSDEEDPEQTPENDVDSDDDGSETSETQEGDNETPSDGNGGDDTDDATPNSGEDTDEATPNDSNESEGGEPIVDIRGVTVPRMAYSGDTMNISVSLENRGDATGHGVVTTTFEGETEPHQTPDIEPGNVDIMSIDLEIDDSTTGKREVTLKTTETDKYETVDIFDSAIGVHGVLFGPDGDRFSGHEVVVIHHTREGNKEDRVELTEDGHFSVDNDPAAPTVSLDVVKRNPGEFDDIPLLYRVVEQKYSRDGEYNLDYIDIPEGYRTRVRLVDSNGNPLEGFEAVDFRTADYGTRSHESFTTTSDGYVVVEDAEKDGIIAPTESDGPLQVVGNHVRRRNYVQLDSVYGSPDGEEFTIEIEDPDEFDQ